jgi:hypothetical protein
VRFWDAPRPFLISKPKCHASSYGEHPGEVAHSLLTQGQVDSGIQRPCRWMSLDSPQMADSLLYVKVALGALVVRAPGSTLAASALNEINITAEVSQQQKDA